ncbi:MAG: AAA family ATPase [Christensenellaceae bacterium]|jgi:chromosome partitioning protein|nr:AAA family ATPase [Christensenellaceae bacterium]
MIIAVSSEKGGTGKTTIATNLSIIRAQKGTDVFLVDADSQRSTIDFAAVREQEKHEPVLCCAGISGPGTYDEIRKMAQKFDDIVIDVGGRDTVTLRKALLIADIVVVPFIPSQLDVWGLDRMNEIVGEAKAMNENLRAISVMNKVDSNPKIVLKEEAVNIAKDLINIEFAGLTLGYRVSYRRCIAEGVAVTELGPKNKKDEKAIAEVMALYEEVFKDA